MRSHRTVPSIRHLTVVAALAQILTACGGSVLPGPPATPGRLSADAPSCKDASLTDLSREPDYRANYLERWKTLDGCQIRLDVISTAHGAMHRRR